MTQWTKTAGLLLAAATAVYSNSAVRALAAAPATAPATAPAAAPEELTADKPAAPASPDAKEGKPVKASQIVVDNGTVEIHVNDANLVEVLRMLSLQSQTNILPSSSVRGSVTANLFDVTVREALDAILHANGYAYREKGNVIYVYSKAEMEAMAKSERVMQTELFRLFYTPAVNVQTLIKPVLSSDGQVAITTAAVAGIASDPSNAGGNNHAGEEMIVVTDSSDVLDKVRKIIKEADRRPQQILVEATILRASLTEDNALGIDFTLLGGVSFAGLTSAASSAADALGGGTLNSTNAGAGKINRNGFGGASTGFTQGVPSGGLRVGVVSNNVAVFLQALEEVTDTVVMANPKVLVLNKQKGEVKVARQDPFRGKTTVNANGLSEQEVEFLETGTKLIFRPYIGDDGYIRLEIHPEDSTPLPARSVDLPPTKLTTEATSNIMVKDGHTVIIGGLFRETVQTTRSQVPGLGNVPLLGNLFKKQADSTQREEVIILLTPHVIKDEGEFSKEADALRKEAEKLRVGVRRGMMPFGRERLAETSYECAVRELNKPNPDRQKALWHLNCATNLNPLFIEAIDLKEKVTGKTLSTADNSSVRAFVRHAILTDTAPAVTLPLSTPITSATRPTAGLAATPTTAPAGGAVAAAVAAAATPTTKPAAESPKATASSAE